MIGVAVIGYGVIGRRVADAVSAQPDMRIAGVACRPSSPTVAQARRQGYPVVSSDPSGGELADLIGASDVVLDCTPAGGVAGRAAIYQSLPDKTVIVQGGESHHFGDVSFNSFANYRDSIGRRRVRVISCSSTGLTRFLFLIDREFGVEHAFAALVRRSADPGKKGRTPFGAMTPAPGQSHHGPDVRTVLPGLPVFSFSADACTTLGHVVTVTVQTRKTADLRALRETLQQMPRIILGAGIRDTAALAEWFYDLGRQRGDHPEIYIWEEGLRVEGKQVSASFCVHMESITVPETVDCIRATLEMEVNPWSSIRRTDEAMGLASLGKIYQAPGKGKEP
jgi:glyceraldehyde-3-phosphate dehydrogenase (NAD(P))